MPDMMWFLLLSLVYHKLVMKKYLGHLSKKIVSSSHEIGITGILFLSEQLELELFTFGYYPRQLMQFMGN